MLGSLIFGAAAGYLVGQAEPLVRSLMARALGRHVRLDAPDLRLLTFAVLLALAGVATALVRGDGSVVLAALGGGLGHFGTRIHAFLRDPDGAQGDPDDDWSGDIGQRRATPRTDPDGSALDERSVAKADRGKSTSGEPS